MAPSAGASSAEEKLLIIFTMLFGNRSLTVSIAKKFSLHSGSSVASGACKMEEIPVLNHRHKSRRVKKSNFREDDYLVFGVGEDSGGSLPLELSSGSNPASEEKPSPTRSLIQEKKNSVEDELENGGEPKSALRREQETVTEIVEEEEESVHSKRSDKSSGSFTFPVLGWDWTGSPEEIPNSKRALQHLKKKKKKKKKKLKWVPFYCCKF